MDDTNDVMGENLMRKISRFMGMAFLLGLLFYVEGMGDTLMSEADALFAKGGMDHLKRCIGIYLKILEKAPENYEANWKSARAHREYGEKAKREMLKDWKDIQHSMLIQLQILRIRMRCMQKYI